MGAETEHGLVGRDRVLRMLAGLVRDLPGATGMLLGGEPGIGKSALLRAFASEARAGGIRVVMTTARASGADRPLGTVRDLLELLRVPAASTSDTVGDLVVAAFERAAADTPTIVVVDDAGRADDMSWAALTHAAHVLQNAPFALVAAMADGSPRLHGSDLPALTLQALPAAASGELLEAAAPGAPVFVRQRILEAAAGNPLALHELATPPVDRWRGRCVRQPVALPMTPRLIRAFMGPVDELPDRTVEVVLAAASNDSDSLSEAVAAAASTLGITPEEALAAYLPAADAQIVDRDGISIRFRSEVARSAVYQAASLTRRRALHEALADLLADDPHRVAWHRAAASLRPDEDLAVALEAASASARARGQVRTALATMDRAARVSQDDVRRLPRLVAAAAMSFEIGRPDFVEGFVQQALALAEGPGQRASVEVVRSLYDLWRPEHGQHLRAYVERAEAAAAAGDDELVRTLVPRITEKANSSAADELPRGEILAAVARMGGTARFPVLAGVLAIVAPVERGAEVLDVVRAAPDDGYGDPRIARILGEAAMTMGDDARAVALLSSAVDGFRRQGRLGLLPFALMDRARSSLAAAGVGSARADVREALVLAGESAQPVLVGRLLALEATIDGLTGDGAAAGGGAERAEQAALDRPALRTDVHVARAAVALAQDDHEEAFARLLRLWAPDAPALAVSRRWSSLGDLVFAAVQCGRRAAVEPLVAELLVAGSAVPSPALRSDVAYASALLADDEHADAAFDHARRTAAACGLPATGRAHLAHGAWLRRHHRIAEARLVLREAVGALDAAGATTGRERADRELRATGLARPAAEYARDDLTPQEHEIATLAAAGLSNREIGARLFLSHRTVGSHLYRVFPKLGIASRAQLRDALAQVAGDDATPATG